MDPFVAIVAARYNALAKTSWTRVTRVGNVWGSTLLLDQVPVTLDSPALALCTLPE